MDEAIRLSLNMRSQQYLKSCSNVFQSALNARGGNVISPFHLSELISLDVQVGQRAETAIGPPALLSDMHMVTLHLNSSKCIFLQGYY